MSWQFPGKAPDFWEHKRVLSLDGSGPGGLWTLHVLRELIIEIGDYEKNGRYASSSRTSPIWGTLNHSYDGPKYSLCHYFDYICGSGMGGLFAMMIGIQNLALEEAIRLAEDVVRTGVETAKTPRKLPFGRRLARKQNTRKLAKTLDSLLPTWNRSLETQEDLCRTVIFATHRLDRWVREPFSLRSYHEPEKVLQNQLTDTRQISLVDAAKATLSENNFEAVKINGFSGSFCGANFYDTDSALEAYNKVTRIHGDPLDLLVSIGRRPDIVRDDSLHELSRKRTFDLWMISDSRDGSIEITAQRAKEFCDGNREEIRTWAKTLVQRREQKARDYRGKSLWVSAGAYKYGRSPIQTVMTMVVLRH